MGLEPINKSYPAVLRSTWQQSASGLLWQPPGVTMRSVSSITGAASEHTSREGILIRRFELHNRSGGAASAGIGFRLANQYWVAGKFTGAGVFTDDTADAQDAGANDFILGTDETDDGFVIAATVPFDWFSINVGTAEVDAGGATVPDHAVRYSDAAGTGWTALGAGGAYTDQFTLTNTVIGTGAREFVWQKPSDWGAVVSLGGIPAGMYAISVTTAQTEVGDTAALATAVEVGTLLSVEAVADNGLYSSEALCFWEPKAEGLIAYFSTANAGNRVYAEATTA